MSRDTAVKSRSFLDLNIAQWVQDKLASLVGTPQREMDHDFPESAYSELNPPQQLRFVVDGLRVGATEDQRGAALSLIGLAQLEIDNVLAYISAEGGNHLQKGHRVAQGVVDLMALFAMGIHRSDILSELGVQLMNPDEEAGKAFRSQFKLFWRLVFSSDENPAVSSRQNLFLKSDDVLDQQVKKWGDFFDVALADVKTAQITVTHGLPELDHEVLNVHLAQVRGAIEASRSIPADDKESFYKRLLDGIKVITNRFEFTRDDGTKTPVSMIRVQHNTSRGPAKGGIRFIGVAPGGDFEAATKKHRGDAFFLSSLMSMKNALANIPYGGGKGEVVAPNDLTLAEQKRLFFTLGLTMAPYVGETQDVPAPDMSTNGTHMSAFRAGLELAKAQYEPGAITGKPLEAGGVAGRVEATGAGGDFITDLALKAADRAWDSVTAVVQGFGNVGNESARLIAKHKGKVLAVSDLTATLVNPNGITLAELEHHTDEIAKAAQAGGEYVLAQTKGFGGTLMIPLAEKPDALLEIGGFNLFVPAAQQYLVGEKQAKLIPDGTLVVGMANFPTRPAADSHFKQRGIPVMPDILANGGGVIVSFIEWLKNIHGRSEAIVAALPPQAQEAMKDRWLPLADKLAAQNWEADPVLDSMREIMEASYDDVISEADALGDVTYPEAANVLAINSLYGAMQMQSAALTPLAGMQH